jgi:hypothetical protein
MADQEIKLVIKADGGVSLKNTTKEINRQRTAVDNLGKSKQRMAKQEYGSASRMKQGAIQTANSTKNFSKLQQSVDGGGGAGGLVRAYALLAANVFALSAAFGVLSRSAQVDTLIESMKQLEIVSGNSVRNVARDLQEASGFGLDFADAMRSTSLALSAGFDTTAITELGEVARNAAVSLGRPMGDALDRIFRGVIKVEPELLDEIGLFVRVKEASAKYASELGVAASELTEFQKRQAFANEAITQGQQKFQDFASIDTDPYSQLAAAFSDIAQEFTSILNSVAGPLLSTLAASKELMVALFVGIAGALLSKAIPALGLFTQTQKAQAAQARADHSEYVASLDLEASKIREKAIISHKAAQEEIQNNIKLQESKVKTTFGGQKRMGADAMLNIARKEKDIEGQIAAIKVKQGALATSAKKAKGDSLKLIEAERKANDKILKQLEKEVGREREILQLQKEQRALGVKKGSLADIKEGRLREKEFTTGAQALVIGKAETRGTREAFSELNKQTQKYSAGLALAGKNGARFKGGLFALKGAFGIMGTAITKVFFKLQMFLMVISILSPLLVKLGKSFGLMSEQQKKVEESTKKAAEQVEILGQKIEHNAKVLTDPESSPIKQAEASLAMSRTFRDTTQSLIEQRKELDQWKATASALALTWENLKRLVGAGLEANVEELEKQAFGNIADNFEDLPDVVKELSSASLGFRNLQAGEAERGRLSKIIADRQKMINKFKEAELVLIRQGLFNGQIQLDHERDRKILTDAQKKDQQKLANLEENKAFNKRMFIDFLREQVGVQEKIAKETAREAEGAATLLSIQEGARDAARQYSDQFITKTDVDKPLAIFRQLTANIALDTEKALVSDKDRALLLESIADGTSEIAKIMSVQAKEAFALAETEKEKIQILKDEEERYSKQQTLLMLNKNVIKEIAFFTAKIKDLTKETTGVIDFSLGLKLKELEIAKSLAQFKVDESMNQAEIAEHVFEALDYTLTLAKTEEAREKAFKAAGITQMEYLQIVNNLIDANKANADLEMHRGTLLEQSNKMAAEVLMKRINAEEKLLKLQQESVMLDAQMGAFAKRGSTKLTATETAKIMIEAEEKRRKIAKQKADIEIAVIKAQFALLKAQLLMLEKNESFIKMNKELVSKGLDPVNVGDITGELDNAAATLEDTVTQGLSNSISKFDVELRSKLESALSSTNKTAVKRLQDSTLYKTLEAFKASDIIVDENQAKIDALEKEREELQKKLTGPLDERGGLVDLNRLNEIQTQIDNINTESARSQFDALRVSIQGMVDALMQLGPGGVLAATISEFGFTFVDTITQMKEASKDGALSTVDKLTAASSAIAGMAAIMSASSQSKIANIDREIEAEKKRDGKSKESQARIAALEKKKEAQARKAFEVNKKLMMAQTVVNTAAGVMATMKDGGFWASPLAMMVAAMGAAQLAIIAGTSYQGGGTIDQNAAPASISVGDRSNRVDVSRGGSSGELAYLRGERGIGTNANNFQAMGGAAGLRKGYANGGEILVGEQGPEVIKPLSPMQVVPNDAMGGKPVSAHFTINAIDAQGVEEVLMGQQGNIISMIRSAANDYGEEFLETVNTDVYGAPKSGGGIDY